MNSAGIGDFGEKLIREATGKFGAFQVEVLVYFFDDSVTRFSRNTVDQSVGTEITGAHVRILSSAGHYSSFFVTNTFDVKKESANIETAMRMARKTRVDHLQSFSYPTRVKTIPDVIVKRTSTITDEERAEMARISIDSMRAHDASIGKTAGTITTRVARTALINSNGLCLTHNYTGASAILTAIAEKNGSIGVGSSLQDSHDFGKIDFTKLSHESAADAVSSLRPKTVNLEKRHEMIFQSEAVGDLLGSFMNLAFSVNRIPEYVQLESQCAGSNMIITDDATDPNNMMATPFDSEGTPTAPLKLVQDGVANAYCLNRAQAAKLNMTPTGHSPFVHDGTYGTKFFSDRANLPTNLVVNPGDQSSQEMIEQSKRNTILVKALSYAGVGMGITKQDVIHVYTRGTWQIENGKIKRPVLSLRLSISLADFMRNVSAVGNSGTMKQLGIGNIPWIKTSQILATQAG